MTEEISKNARNEYIKLQATFFNNLAVATFVTTVFVPYMALMLHAHEITHAIDTIRLTHTIERPVAVKAIGYGLALLLGFYVGKTFRAEAVKTIMMLKD